MSIRLTFDRKLYQTLQQTLDLRRPLPLPDGIIINGQN
ncbi:unnamed protein product, partial [Vitis vinifera]